MNRTPEQDIAACRAFAFQLKEYGVARVLNDAADQIERLRRSVIHATNPGAPNDPE